MSRTVWKFPLLDRVNELAVPRSSTLLHVGIDPAFKEPAAWFEVTPHFPAQPLLYSLYGTGWEIGLSDVHRGSVVLPSGLVWHVYETLRVTI